MRRREGRLSSHRATNMGLTIFWPWRLCTLLFVILMVHPSIGTQTIDEILEQAQGHGHASDYMDDSSMVKVELDMVFSVEEYKDMMNQGKAYGTGKRSSSRQKRKALRNRYKRWTNLEVPYTIESSFSTADHTEFQAAVNHWNKYTCLNIRPSTRYDRNYIRVIDGDGCWSRVGMIGGAQRLSLPNNSDGNCRRKTPIVHELGHAIGFHHEQTRPDRDEYVTIHNNNIQWRMEHNFERHPTEVINDHGVPYDYTSIMHYGPRAFGKYGKRTITTKDPAYQDIIGTAQELSFRDIKLANLMYNCAKQCPKKACPGEGYMAKDCKCYCPGNPIKECSDSPGPLPGCVDVSEFCISWSWDCPNPDPESFMRKNCRKTCNFCRK